MAKKPDVLISADSHVIEPHDLWLKRLPVKFKDIAPVYPERKVGNTFVAHDGGYDPARRAMEMAKDGVSGEILYASHAMDQFGIPNAELQEACFRIYNDWLIDYCSHEPERLFGVAAISLYNIGNAVKELKRCKKAGMRGSMIWLVPPEDLSFASDHYDRFWAASQEMDMPVSFHILTGMPYAHQYGPQPKTGRISAVEGITDKVNVKMMNMADTLLRIMASGGFERFPKLKLVLVEQEASWLPFMLTQWDKYIKKQRYDSPMTMLATEYFQRNVFVTFFNDIPIGSLLRSWGQDNCMWSNDFPHQNSTWPNSDKVIARDLGDLPAATRLKVVHDNVMKLYSLPNIAPVEVAPEAVERRA